MHRQWWQNTIGRTRPGKGNPKHVVFIIPQLVSLKFSHCYDDTRHAAKHRKGRQRTSTCTANIEDLSNMCMSTLFIAALYIHHYPAMFFCQKAKTLKNYIICSTKVWAEGPEDLGRKIHAQNPAISIKKNQNWTKHRKHTNKSRACKWTMSTLSSFQPICSSCPRPATRTTGNHQEWVGWSNSSGNCSHDSTRNQSAQCNHNIHADPYPMDPIASWVLWKYLEP
jgi:hypothetical protein